MTRWSTPNGLIGVRSGLPIPSNNSKLIFLSMLICALFCFSFLFKYVWIEFVSSSVASSHSNFIRHCKWMRAIKKNKQNKIALWDQKQKSRASNGKGHQQRRKKTTRHNKQIRGWPEVSFVVVGHGVRVLLLKYLIILCVTDRIH